LNKYYDILELPYGANKNSIKKAYYKLAKKHHPDICNGSHSKQKFIEINEAYEFLINLELYKKIKSKRDFQKQPSNPVAREKVKVKTQSKRKGQEFDDYKKNSYKKDKNKLAIMFLYLLSFPVLVSFVIWINNDPTLVGYDPSLPVTIFITALIPICLFYCYLTFVFFKNTSSQKRFDKMWS
tara:strand:- start:1054 stop:1599 length:546 start_codon:yes stop_codon:yes gene_type:complete